MLPQSATTWWGSGGPRPLSAHTPSTCRQGEAAQGCLCTASCTHVTGHGVCAIVAPAETLPVHIMVSHVKQPPEVESRAAPWLTFLATAHAGLIMPVECAFQIRQRMISAADPSRLWLLCAGLSRGGGSSTAAMVSMRMRHISYTTALSTCGRIAWCSTSSDPSTCKLEAVTSCTTTM